MHLNKILIIQKRAPIILLTDASIQLILFLPMQFFSNLMNNINNSNTPLNILKLFQKKTSSIHTTSEHPPERIYMHISTKDLPKKDIDILVKENDHRET